MHDVETISAKASARVAAMREGDRIFVSELARVAFPYGNFHVMKCSGNPSMILSGSTPDKAAIVAYEKGCRNAA